MQALSASTIVRIWEVGQHQHSTDRAMLLLTLAWPSLPPAALNALTIGQRNAHLLSLRKNTLGSLANCVARCPACNEQLEFTIDIQTMLPSEVTEPLEPGKIAEQIYTLDVDSYHLSFRVLTGEDLARAGQIVDRQAGRDLLLECCVLQVLRDGQLQSVKDLPEPLLQALTEAIVENDPLAEIQFALNCPACQENWTLLFDIVSFFWAELDAQARRLLHDVHTIASAYGWRESEILALSSARRKFYQELIR